jgi:peptidoglycan/xylan/chitin deacetylase (PgdA/CDA1 family)
MLNSLKILEKLTDGLKRGGRESAWQLGLSQEYIKNQRGARILIYHGVCLHDPFRFNTLFVKLAKFENHLRLYKRYFNIISLNDFYHQRFSKDKYNICLTFDDGFTNNYKYVLPLLEHFKIPATFFITGIRDAGYDILWNDYLSIAVKYGPSEFIFRNEKYIKHSSGKYISTTGKSFANTLRSTGFAEKQEMMRVLQPHHKNVDQDYWLQMTPGQIRALAQSEWATIGNHSYYHNDLAMTPRGSVREDLQRSKEFLENMTGTEIKSLAFPYGSYSKEAVEEAKNAGFSQLLAMEFLFPEDSHDPVFRERLTINPFISSVNQLHANITGHYK